MLLLFAALLAMRMHTCVALCVLAASMQRACLQSGTACSMQGPLASNKDSSGSSLLAKLQLGGLRGSIGRFATCCHVSRTTAGLESTAPGRPDTSSAMLSTAAVQDLSAVRDQELGQADEDAAGRDIRSEDLTEINKATAAAGLPRVVARGMPAAASGPVVLKETGIVQQLIGRTLSRLKLQTTR
jgi:hypothetical protein